MINQLAFLSWTQGFSLMVFFNPSICILKSANIRFNLRFSSSSFLIFFTSEAIMPPYFDFQLNRSFGYTLFTAHILDHSTASNLMQDFHNLTFCITTLLHYHSPFCFALCRRNLIYTGPILRGGIHSNRETLLVRESNLPLQLTDTTFQIKTTLGPSEGDQVWD
jgi:hypothetical protein